MHVGRSGRPTPLGPRGLGLTESSLGAAQQGASIAAHRAVQGAADGHRDRDCDRPWPPRRLCIPDTARAPWSSGGEIIKCAYKMLGQGGEGGKAGPQQGLGLVGVARVMGQWCGLPRHAPL